MLILKTKTMSAVLGKCKPLIFSIHVILHLFLLHHNVRAASPVVWKIELDVLDRKRPPYPYCFCPDHELHVQPSAPNQTFLPLTNLMINPVISSLNTKLFVKWEYDESLTQIGRAEVRGPDIPGLKVGNPCRSRRSARRRCDGHRGRDPRIPPHPEHRFGCGHSPWQGCYIAVSWSNRGGLSCALAGTGIRKPLTLPGSGAAGSIAD